MRLPATLLLGVLAIVAAACGGGKTTTPAVGHPCRGERPPIRYDRIVLVVLENHDFADVAGHSPYLNGLAKACGLATNYHSVAHPSLPNYLALTSGSTHGIASDCTDCTAAGTSIFGQLGYDWRAYVEGLPRQGFQGPSSGDYSKKHNPAAYYPANALAYATRTVPLTDLRSGPAGRFDLVIPDLCNDEHDCALSTGDAWLGKWLPAIFASRSYKTGKTAVFVTYDEGAGPDDRVYTVVASRSVRPHMVVVKPFDHYSLLRTVENLLALPCLANACRAQSMAGAFRLGQ